MLLARNAVANGGGGSGMVEVRLATVAWKRRAGALVTVCGWRRGDARRSKLRFERGLAIVTMNCIVWYDGVED